MIALAPADTIESVALIGAHCDDIAIGAGATLLQLLRDRPGVRVHALVLTGGKTVREAEERRALRALCGDAELHLQIADYPDGRLPEHWGAVKACLAEFRRSCSPDLVFAPQRDDAHQDHRLLAELVPTEFRDHVVLGYEILKWESDLPRPAVFAPVDEHTARRKAAVLRECYPSQHSHDWFDDDAFVGLLRIRGVQCKKRYAEAFVADKTVLDFAHVPAARV